MRVVDYRRGLLLGEPARLKRKTDSPRLDYPDIPNATKRRYRLIVESWDRIVYPWQSMVETELSYDSLSQMARVTREFSIDGVPDFRRRRRKLSWSHYREVLPCESDVADTWLDTSERKKWNVKELREARKELRDKNRRSEQAWPTDTFGVIYCDPPWKYKHVKTESRMASQTLVGADESCPGHIILRCCRASQKWLIHGSTPPRRMGGAGKNFARLSRWTC